MGYARAILLAIFFVVLAVVFSPWWLLAIIGLLVDEYVTLIVAAIVLALNVSPWWWLLLLGLLI